jgi:hypothetical protein
MQAGLMMNRLAEVEAPQDVPLAVFVDPWKVNVDHLRVLDREVLRWMANQFRYASRRVAVRGTIGEDQRAVNAAVALLRDGALRPAGQLPVRGAPDEDAADIRPNH